jgi:hypothetical protein
MPKQPEKTRLLLRVHSAKDLPHSALSSQEIYCKLYVSDKAMTHGSARNLFRKNSLTASEESTATATASATPTSKVEEGSNTDRIFRTKTVPHVKDTGVAQWDENFDVVVLDATKEILSVRMKRHHYFFAPVIGVCAIPLKQLKMGHTWDNWVPLMKGDREVARLRIQLVLSPVHDTHKATLRPQDVLQADIKTALAANHAADDAIERLVASATFRRARNRVNGFQTNIAVSEMRIAPGV